MNGLLSVKDYFEQRAEDKYYEAYKARRLDQIELQGEKYKYEEERVIGLVCDIVTYVSSPTCTYDNPNITFMCDPLNEVVVGRELYDWSR